MEKGKSRQKLTDKKGDVTQFLVYIYVTSTASFSCNVLYPI